MEHLLAAWPGVLEQLRGARRIILLSDYDGTLTPIVGKPSEAVLSAGLACPLGLAGAELMQDLFHRPQHGHLPLRVVQLEAFDPGFELVQAFGLGI